MAEAAPGRNRCRETALSASVIGRGLTASSADDSRFDSPNHPRPATSWHKKLQVLEQDPRTMNSSAVVTVLESHWPGP